MIEPGRHWGIWHLRHLGLDFVFSVCMYILICKMTGPIPYPSPLPHRSFAHRPTTYVVFTYFLTSRQTASKFAWNFHVSIRERKKKAHGSATPGPAYVIAAISIKWHPAIIIISTYQIFQNPQRKFKKKKKKKLQTRHELLQRRKAVRHLSSSLLLVTQLLYVHTILATSELLMQVQIIIAWIHERARGLIWCMQAFFLPEQFVRFWQREDQGGGWEGGGFGGREESSLFPTLVRKYNMY